MKRLLVLALGAAALAACSATGGSGYRLTPAATAPYSIARADKIKLSGTYPVASGTVVIAGMTAAPDGRLWFTEYAGDYVGAIDSSGAARTFRTGTGAQLWGIAVQNKKLWTGGNGVAFRITLKGKFTARTVKGAKIGDFVAGPNGYVWFADYGNKKIGRVASTNYVVKEFRLPAGASPNAVAAGSDGNVWITDSGRSKIVKMNADGKVLASYGRGITKGEYLDFIVAAPDGNLYFSENDPKKALPDKIARITTKGKISEIGNLPPGSAPSRLTVGKDGNVYFAFLNLQAVGIVDAAARKVTYKHVGFAHDAGAYSIAAGPDNRLWFGGNATIYAVSY